ncbi:TPA: hypothetical protein ACPZHP_000362 [Yersinia enterocolitica]|uniref:hypothetical protein n=1 Tax=Yersinia enterocolitica TaxID=630 RepID=UPI003303884B|nr:hypothetical protein [Yersinia enterocolitica]HDL7730930.1 hypothetical protein [Yersinia enterocolitica]HDM8296653.1 hypothetical protein [Yersinia enterocolitica]HDM8300489.1 hypothetical protein [Yersinia enterocolitica]HDM8326073.1 hypothetical protein [Yersinia enterocolitica]
MLKERYRDNFIKATLLLKTLQDNPERLDIILELHKLIIRGIVKQEELIAFDKSGSKRLDFFRKNKKPNRAVSVVVKIMRERMLERIKQRKNIIFLYKCFGDGIAHIYQSMYALKHLYYDSNYQVKEDAGYISGKRGFLWEWKIFLTALKYNVPAVMSDVTNIIRNGDVCALGGKDPLPIEVKLTKHANPGARVRRQIDHISEIVSFYHHDFARQFRGGFDAYRIPLAFKHVDYINDINYLAEACHRKNYAYKEVEKGLVYFCINTKLNESDLLAAMERMTEIVNLSSTLTISINPDEIWSVAYPFTLSLTSSNLIKFIYSDINIYILIDLEVIRSMFFNNKIHATFLMDGNSAMQICKDPDDLLKGVYRISELHFLRNIASFLSVEIFVDECSKSLSDDELSTKSVTKEMYENLLRTGQIVDEDTIKKWSEIKDCLRDPDNDC